MSFRDVVRQGSLMAESPEGRSKRPNVFSPFLRLAADGFYCCASF
jgi:hypothetical protein